MAARLDALSFDAHDPQLLARFWAGMLEREMVVDPVDGYQVLPKDEVSFRLRFLATEHEKYLPNYAHFDLTSESLEHQKATVARALELGGRHIDIGQGPEIEHVVMADPEGNEFCVIEPGNKFLAGTGFIGALASDGTQALGYFWHEALGWPLVWDQDEETAIQDPRGGTKITWGGPPVEPKPAKNRLHFDLTPPAGGDLEAEVERLISLGASRRDIGQGDVAWVVMSDPDGNEFCVHPAAE